MVCAREFQLLLLFNNSVPVLVGVVYGERKLLCVPLIKYIYSLYLISTI